MSTDVGQQALVDQWERTAAAFGRPVDDAAYARLQELSGGAPLYGAAIALVNGPVLTLIAATLVFAAFRRTRAEVTFRQVLAVAAHAGVILAVRQMIAAPAAYIRETTSSATAVGVWFPMFDEASPAARFLGTLDLMMLWWVTVLAVGVAVLYRRRATRVAAMLTGAYAAIALVLAITMVMSGGE
jgi:hypothetical protein